MTIDHDQEAKHHLAMVITFANFLETRMKHVIAAYAKIPQDRLAFFHSYISNNSTMNFAAKVKLVLAIADAMKVPMNKNAFYVLLSRRNAFAHQDLVDSIRLSTDSGGETTVAFVVESIKSNGKMETISRKSAYIEFMRAHIDAERDINVLQKAIHANNQSATPDDSSS